MGGTRGSGLGAGLEDRLGVAAAMPALTASLALEIAPMRVNLIAAGFVDTGLSASLLGNGLATRRQQQRATLPIGRVVGPADIAALAVHIMINTAITARHTRSTAARSSSNRRARHRDTGGPHVRFT